MVVNITSTANESCTILPFTDFVHHPNLTIQVNQSDHLDQPDIVNQSSGVSIVNCYRAVPVQIVNNCNNNENDNNNSNVSVNSYKSERNSSIEDEEEEEVTVIDQVNVNNNNNDQIDVCSEVQSNMDIDAIQLDNSAEVERIFKSTEVQTDSLQNMGQSNKHITPTVIQTQPEVNLSREQRRRERRERRQLRRPPHPHPRVPNRQSFEILPDILQNQLPPPYATLPLPPNSVYPPIISTMTADPSDDSRYTFSLPVIRRSPSERSGKGCCGGEWFWDPPFRVLIAVVALSGVACAIGGAAYGIIGLANSSTSHLTASLLVGVGVTMVLVSGAAWRLIDNESPPNVGYTGTRRRQFCRTQHGPLFSEFHHRLPPPSYQVSMQEYRLRLLLLDRERQTENMMGSSCDTPPPTYRSHNGSLIRAPLSTRFSSQFGTESVLSLPPSYRNVHQSVTSLNETNENELAIISSTSENCLTLQEYGNHEQQPQQQEQQQQQRISIISDTSVNTLNIFLVNDYIITELANMQKLEYNLSQNIIQFNRFE